MCMQTNGVASTSGRGEGLAVWAAVINFERQGKADAGEAEAKSGSSSKKGARYIVDVLANCAEDSVPGHGPKRCLLCSRHTPAHPLCTDSCDRKTKGSSVFCNSTTIAGALLSFL